jgi:hypothetical protein
LAGIEAVTPLPALKAVGGACASVTTFAEKLAHRDQLGWDHLTSVNVGSS